MTPHGTLLAAAKRLQELDGLNRKRSLTHAEADELAVLEFARQSRLRRLPGQIAACEAKLLRLRAEMAVLTLHSSPESMIHGKRGTVIIDEFPFQAELH